MSATASITPVEATRAALDRISALHAAKLSNKVGPPQ